MIFKNTQKSLKEVSDMCSLILCNCTKRNFSKRHKNTDVTPAFKKDNALLAKNYRPVKCFAKSF